MATFFDEIPGVPVNGNAPDFVKNFDDAVSKCSIVVPNGVAQIASFAFDYRETEEVHLDAEITDHWLEDNTAVHDHIAVKPAIVVLSGFVAELNLSASTLKTILAALTAATNALSVLPIFLGAQTPGNTQALAAAISQAEGVVVQIAQTVARAAQISNMLKGLLSGPARNRQQQAYLELQAYQRAGIVFTVYTPYQTFYNMAIESLHVVDPEDSKYWSKFTVRMKQLQFVGGASSPNYAANLSAPVAIAQGQAATNVGATAGTALAVAAGTVKAVGSVISIPKTLGL